MPVVLSIGFLPVLVERDQCWHIVHREENGALLLRCVVMLVPAPGGDDEHIPLLPGKAHPIDDGLASPLKYVVDGTADVPVGLSLHGWSQHLNPAREGVHSRASRMRINVFQRYVIKGAGIHLRQVGERVLRIGPLVGVHGRMLHRTSLPGRLQLADTVFEHGTIESLGDFLRLVGIRFEETGIQVVVQGDVQSVHPDGWLVCLTTVIVPEPGGGELMSSP